MYSLRFARLYDELTDDYDYESWAARYVRLAEMTGKSDIKTVCECGCGTGSMAVRFAKMGFKVTGLDISPAMLDVASRKARGEGLEIRFIQRDMRSFELPRPVDAVFCPCDGVNYLMGEADLSAFFNCAFKWLKPSGAFAFDISTPEKLRGMAGQTYFEDREDVSYFWRNELAGDVLNMSLAFFCRRPGGLYERFDERQSQKLHEAADILKAMALAGFEGARVFGETGVDGPAPGDQRWYFAAARP